MKAKYAHLLFKTMSIRASVLHDNGNESIIKITMTDFSVDLFEHEVTTPPDAKHLASITRSYTLETLDTDLDGIKEKVFIRWLIKGLHGTPLEMR